MPYMVITNSGELYHHGILGQKWGQRNGPPYPLGASDHSAREKKAGWRSSLVKVVKASNANKKRSAQDYKDYKSDLKSAKQRRKERDKAILDRVTKEEIEIEKNYKRFENLSEKDEKRSLDADRRATKDWEKSKAQYKQDRINAKKTYQKKLDEGNRKTINSFSNKDLIKAGAEMAGLGAMSFALGKVLSSYGSSKSNAGMQYVGAFLEGSGQGLLVGGASATAANLYSKYYYKKH